MISNDGKRPAPHARAIAERPTISQPLAAALCAIGSAIESPGPSDELRQLAAVLKNLSRIATLTARAREHRLAGRIRRAETAERQVEASYAVLPREVRW